MAHNAGFDVSFIEENCQPTGAGKRVSLSVDTVALARISAADSCIDAKLDTVAKALHIYSGSSSPGGGRCGLYGRDLS